MQPRIAPQPRISDASKPHEIPTPGTKRVSVRTARFPTFAEVSREEQGSKSPVTAKSSRRSPTRPQYEASDENTPRLALGYAADGRYVSPRAHRVTRTPSSQSKRRYLGSNQQGRQEESLNRSLRVPLSGTPNQTAVEHSPQHEAPVGRLTRLLKQTEELAVRRLLLTANDSCGCYVQEHSRSPSRSCR